MLAIVKLTNVFVLSIRTVTDLYVIFTEMGLTSFKILTSLPFAHLQLH